MKIAIIGSGIAGLTCAWRLAGHHQVTLFEAGATPGGHTATVDVSTPQGTWAIDTGFIVYNDRTYPRFMGLLSELGISGQKTQMSFSVHNPQTGLEYNGHTLTSLFAQRRNLVNPAFWRLLGEIVRFNRLAKQALEGDVGLGAGGGPQHAVERAALLCRQRTGRAADGKSVSRFPLQPNGHDLPLALQQPG